VAPPPSKLTEEIAQAIVAAVGRGLHKYHIAGSVGISRQTLWQWIERGEAAEPGDEAFVAFLTRYKKAQADFCQARVGTILEASEKTWTAAAWMLERLYPDEYSDPAKELHQLRAEVAELRKLIPLEDTEADGKQSHLDTVIEQILESLPAIGSAPPDDGGQTAGSDAGGVPVRPEPGAADKDAVDAGG